MKIKYLLLLLCFLNLNCHKESALVADGDPNSMVLRYTFPQGNGSWDVLAQDIVKKYSTYPIYRELKNEDFNRSWLGGSSGSETNMFGQSLKDDAQAEWSMKFLNNLLDMFSVKVLNKILPTYIYLGYDVYEYRYDEYWETHNYDAMQLLTNGSDFWSLCFETETPEYGLTQPVTDDEVFNLRGTLTLSIVMNVIQQKNKLETPSEFYTDFDYEAEIINDDINDNHGNVRGFLGSLYEFEPSYYDQTVWRAPGVEDNFYNYVLHLIAFDRDDFVNLYSEFPKAIQYYDFVNDYLKKNYDWDIQKVRNRNSVIKY